MLQSLAKDYSILVRSSAQLQHESHSYKHKFQQFHFPSVSGGLRIFANDRNHWINETSIVHGEEHNCANEKL